MSFKGEEKMQSLKVMILGFFVTVFICVGCKTVQNTDGSYAKEAQDPLKPGGELICTHDVTITRNLSQAERVTVFGDKAPTHFEVKSVDGCGKLTIACDKNKGSGCALTISESTEIEGPGAHHSLAVGMDDSATPDIEEKAKELYSMLALTEHVQQEGIWYYKQYMTNGSVPLSGQDSIWFQCGKNSEIRNREPIFRCLISFLIAIEGEIAISHDKTVKKLYGAFEAEEVANALGKSKTITKQTVISCSTGTSNAIETYQCSIKESSGKELVSFNAKTAKEFYDAFEVPEKSIQTGKTKSWSGETDISCNAFVFGEKTIPSMCLIKMK